ncbi:MAG: ubiquinol oxidase subunit II [Fulvimarina manganoxydans]|uniref:ubiquinol oxidase subunit II n=1 Tax=Fulvimarina manganoxydans TaxID=937218 RepID=UPI0023579AFA|nr:ubiquinol oxidase subunit II [Fulvimarina manganoxydans]MCK5931529.1 ubiquinol oxidase subunit II [Fulvimarina manganoxydans]
MGLIRTFALASLAFLLAGCGDYDVLFPAGDIAARQRDMLLIATGLMLLIIIPVIAMAFIFAWRYRAANKAHSGYDPDWDHSTKLELVIWTAPLLIIVILGAVTWVGTHLLDPYRPLDAITTSETVDTSAEPLEVEVVALDWKWMFIYPQYGIATINELAAPVDRPITFKLTAESVMNAFYVPTLAGMIYAMPGMETKLHAVVNAPGVYQGLASHYNGAGFSDMRFKFHGLSDQDFDAWVEKAKTEGGTLDRATYLELARPSEAAPVQYFSSVDEGLYPAILGMCVREGKLCMQEIHHINAQGGSGERNIPIEALTFDAHPIDTFEPGGHGSDGITGEPQGATAPASDRQPHSDQPAGENNANEGEGSVAPPQLNDN